MVMSLRSKWAVGKAVRAGLALEGASRTSLTLLPICFAPPTVKLVRDVTDPAAAHARQHKEASFSKKLAKVSI
jgi:hypothetical protein